MTSLRKITLIHTENKSHQANLTKVLTGKNGCSIFTQEYSKLHQNISLIKLEPLDNQQKCTFEGIKVSDMSEMRV